MPASQPESYKNQSPAKREKEEERESESESRGNNKKMGMLALEAYKDHDKDMWSDLLYEDLNDVKS